MDKVISAQSVLDTIASQSLNSDNSSKEIYRIGDLAKEFDVSLRTLRFYEDRGLISPKRAGSTRLYSPGDRTRLKVIILAKNVGFSLVDIQELLNLYDESGSLDDINKIGEKFQSQLSALQIQRQEIERSIHDLNNAIGAIKSLN